MRETTTPTRRGPRRSLDTDRVVQAALDLLDQDGAAKLSLRGVAARLGVRPNALYTYVPDRAALERALVDRLLAQADPSILDADRPWRSRILEYACALRRVLLDRPAAVPLFFSAPMDGPNAATVGERLLALLVAAGLDPATASRASYAVIVHVLGSVALTAAELPAAGTSEEGLVAARRERLAAVDPDALPLTAATAGTAATWDTEEQFRWALDRLLDGCVPAPDRG